VSWLFLTSTSLLEEASKRAQRHLEIDGTAVHRKQRFGNGDRQRNARPNAAQRAQPLQFAVARRYSAQEIVDEQDVAVRLLRDDEAVLDGMSFREHAADVIEKLEPKIGKHALRAHDLCRLAVEGQRILRKLGIGSVRNAVGVQRGDERHPMLRPPPRMRAYEIEWIEAGSLRLSDRDGNDEPEKLVAMSL